MKVAFFINDFHKGGAERLVKDLVVEISANSNIDPLVIAAKREGILQSEFEYYNIPIHTLNTDISPTSIPKAARALSNALSELDVDLVHSHLPFAHVVSRLACSRQDIAHISTYHSVRDHKTLSKRLAERMTRPLSDQIICVSEGVRRSYPCSEGMKVIYNAIDVKAFKQRISNSDPPELVTTLPDNTTVFLNVGRCVELKRQEDIIKAMSQIDIDNAHLLILGDGPRQEFLENLVDENGLNDSVTLTGYIDDVEPYYGIADVFVSSSLNEGLPTTHIEAMAAELPIVSTNIPGVTEVVEPGVNGYLVPPKNPSQLSKHMGKIKNNRKLFGNQGYKFAKETFSIGPITDSHINLYHSTVE